MASLIDHETLARLRQNADLSAYCFAEALGALAAASGQPDSADLEHIAETAQAATFALVALTEYIQIAARADNQTTILICPTLQ